jgi:hypothetical protein
MKYDFIEIIFSVYVEDGPCGDNGNGLECLNVIVVRNVVGLLVPLLWDMQVS